MSIQDCLKGLLVNCDEVIKAKTVPHACKKQSFSFYSMYVFSLLIILVVQTDEMLCCVSQLFVTIMKQPREGKIYFGSQF